MKLAKLLFALVLAATPCMAQSADADETATYALLLGSSPERMYHSNLRKQLPGLHPRAKWVKAVCETTLLDAYYRDRVKPSHLNVWLKRISNRQWTHVLIQVPAVDINPWLPEMAFEGLRLTVQRILERSPSAQIWIMGPGTPSRTQAEKVVRADLRRIAAGLSVGFFSKTAGEYQFERSPKVEGDYVGYVTPLNLRGTIAGLAFGTSTMRRSVGKKLPGVFERDSRRDLDWHTVDGSMTDGLDDKRLRERLKKSKADFCWAQDKGEDFEKTLKRFRRELKQDAPIIHFLRYHDLSTIENVRRIGPMMEMEGQIAKQLESKAIPLRAAWGRMWERYPNVAIMERDLKHATDAGMRLITALTYAIVTGEDPSNIMTGAPAAIAAEVVYELGNLRLSPGGFAAPPMTWHASYETALQWARDLDQPILLVAGDGKKFSQLTEELIGSEANRERLQNFVMLRIKLPSEASVVKELDIDSGIHLFVLDAKTPDPAAEPLGHLSGKRSSATVTKFLDDALADWEE